MSPFTRVSASLVLTLAVWGPSAFAAVQRGGVDLGALSVRFVVIFALARLAMRWIDWLVRNYHTPANAPSARTAIHVDPADVATVTATAPTRRRNDEPGDDDLTDADLTRRLPVDADDLRVAASVTDDSSLPASALGTLAEAPAGE